MADEDAKDKENLVGKSPIKAGKTPALISTKPEATAEGSEDGTLEKPSAAETHTKEKTAKGKGKGKKAANGEKATKTADEEGPTLDGDGADAIVTKAGKKKAGKGKGGAAADSESHGVDAKKNKKRSRNYHFTRCVDSIEVTTEFFFLFE